jgi:hypothetical protein
LKPGMFATVELQAELKPDALLVPDSAVLRSGEKNTVFVAIDDGHFEPRDVQLGARADNNAYEVISGLTEGERVVTSGQFMLDSESQLREAIQKMLKPVANATAAQVASAPVQMTPTPDSKTAPQEYVCPTEFACPMPDHMTIKYNHGGKCPICGMTLIPASDEKLAAPSPTVTPAHQH